jgi:hypothetical protein
VLLLVGFGCAAVAAWRWGDRVQVIVFRFLDRVAGHP